VTVVEPIRPEWRDRDVPLAAAAVIGHGPAGVALARSARERVRAGTPLGVASGHEFVVVVGDESDLPWSDGAVYLGWEATVLVPTTREPVPRTALIAAAARRAAGAHDLVIVLPGLVLHTANPRPVTRASALRQLAAAP
jgi:hypothetical protein